MISWSNHKVLLSFTYNKLLITVRSMEVVFHGRTSESTLLNFYSIKVVMNIYENRYWEVSDLKYTNTSK